MVIKAVAECLQSFVDEALEIEDQPNAEGRFVLDSIPDDLDEFGQELWDWQGNGQIGLSVFSNSNHKPKIEYDQVCLQIADYDKLIH